LAKIVNLRLARKHKKRSGKEQAAAENRLKHGRSAKDAKLTRLERALDDRRLEGHRRASAEDSDA